MPRRLQRNKNRRRTPSEVIRPRRRRSAPTDRRRRAAGSELTSADIDRPKERRNTDDSQRHAEDAAAAMKAGQNRPHRVARGRVGARGAGRSRPRAGDAMRIVRYSLDGRPAGASSSGIWCMSRLAGTPAPAGWSGGSRPRGPRRIHWGRLRCGAWSTRFRSCRPAPRRRAARGWHRGESAGKTWAGGWGRAGHPRRAA